jgi:hypothetical protein
MAGSARCGRGWKGASPLASLSSQKTLAPQFERPMDQAKVHAAMPGGVGGKALDFVAVASETLNSR